MGLVRELATILGDGDVIDGAAPAARRYLADATESQAVSGHAVAVVRPADPDLVAAVVAYAYAHDVPITPRGGGTGYAGGAVPDGGIVLSLDRLSAPADVEPEYWRGCAPAGAITADVRRRARENGLYYPPDPGSLRTCTLGGNLATNAGGPHTFKYGVTGAWATGLQVVLPPGDLVTIGGAARKDVGGYDLVSLLIGSEGTLGIITAAWLRLIPAPPVQIPVVGLYPDVASGCAAVSAAMTCGVVPAALEYLDRGAIEASLGTLAAVMPGLQAGITEHTSMLVIAEADTSDADARELEAALAGGAVAAGIPDDPRGLWRWREEVSASVVARRGGKVSEDIVVPLEHLQAAIEATLEIGARHGLPACSWGHAGDGNLHATLLVDRGDPTELSRARAAGEELMALAAELGGAVSGEHGLGTVKRGALARQWPPAALAAHEQIKRALDPKGLLNPGTKVVR